MYELWGREREDNQYHFISYFDDEKQFHYMIDTLDRDKYSEGMIICDQHCLFYQEFKKYEPIKLKRKSR